MYSNQIFVSKDMELNSQILCSIDSMFTYSIGCQNIRNDSRVGL